MRGNAARVAASALAVLALVGLVAIAATGSTPAGSNERRAPADAFLDTLLSLGLVLLVPAAAVFVYGLLQRKAIAREVASRRYPRTSLTTLLAFMAAITAIAYFRISTMGFGSPQEVDERPAPGLPLPPDTSAPGTGTVRVYEPEFAWLPVLALVLLAAIAGGAFSLSNRRRRGVHDEDELVRRAFADALDETLDDLRAEPDPRRAVIAAYARFERVLGAHGLPRRASEAPEEYLVRILRRLEVGERSVRRLTDLFEEAKFSQHDVDLAMKEEAIDALARVRDELRAARAAPEPRVPPPVPEGRA
ncbi:MAG TPA: DUF4129 domain-containing protein [Gaiellaceae bacterium]|nr:DUF4129 domain-containing protein [Gaiellaceae bacterium]